MTDPQPTTEPTPEPSRRIDWEAFYRDYRKPGYISGYEIVNKLGSGAFGLVFKARKQSIGKDYAIKFLKVDDDHVREAVHKELASIAYFAQVDHPNLVAVEDQGEVDGIPYIVMTFAGQDTLRDRMDAGDLDRESSLRLFVQIARGVKALHDRSLVHFDLKPANVYLKGDVARVGDYGLAKLVTHSQNSMSVGRGTPYYMPPEMLDRRGDHRSDIYSLGVMLFEMLVGEPPFQGDSQWEVLRKHETAAVELPDSIADPERRVILRCLEKDPNKRYVSAEDLLEDLCGQPDDGVRAGGITGSAPPPTHSGPRAVQPAQPTAGPGVASPVGAAPESDRPDPSRFTRGPQPPPPPKRALQRARRSLTVAKARSRNTDAGSKRPARNEPLSQPRRGGLRVGTAIVIGLLIMIGLVFVIAIVSRVESTALSGPVPQRLMPGGLRTPEETKRFNSEFESLAEDRLHHAEQIQRRVQDQVEQRLRNNR